MKIKYAEIELVKRKDKVKPQKYLHSTILIVLL